MVNLARRNDLEAHKQFLKFDTEGPSIDGVKLTLFTERGWIPTERSILEQKMLAFSFVEFGALVESLNGICKAMNLGDFATAAIASEQLTRPILRKAKVQAMSKAATNDPKHPGYPAGAPDKKGGQFRFKEDAAPEERDSKMRRLRSRRGLRAVFRRLLTSKRMARLTTEILGDMVPGADIVSGAASLADAVKFLSDLGADAADTDAAVNFVEKGPQNIEDLQMSTELEGFLSYDRFRKADLDKRFGPAGDGYEYHHIIEQKPNEARFSAQDLNSTTNIVKIPRLIHEEVSSFYSKHGFVDGREMSVRDFLRDKSFVVQREWGLKALRYAGAIR